MKKATKKGARTTHTNYTNVVKAPFKRNVITFNRIISFYRKYNNIINLLGIELIAVIFSFCFYQMIKAFCITLILMN